MRLRRTTLTSLIFASLLAGLVLGRLGFAAVPIIPATALTAGLLGLSALRRPRVLPAALILATLTLGLWRAGTWQSGRTTLTSLIGQKLDLTATVADDPATNLTTHQVDYAITSITLLNGPDGARPLPGTVAVHDYPVQLQRGYRLHLTGKLKSGFGNQPVELSFPKVEILSRAQSPLEIWRQLFFAGLRTALPDPQASFGLGLLVGIRALIPKPLQTELALVGLSHLVAVSGYNLTIIVSAINRLLRRAGHGPSFVASLWVIAGFLTLTGATPSIVRASLVSVLSLTAAFYGRRFAPLTLIALTAALTAAFNPAYLTDIGWQLSFLAFFGILVLAPAIEARLGRPKLVIVRLLIESVSAQILTLPLIMFYFNQLSLVSPLTNFLVLPLVPFAMAASFVAGLAGLFLSAFAGWFAWPAALVLNFMLGLINYFAAQPWSARPGHLSLSGLLAAYAIILILTIILTQARPKIKSEALQSRHKLEKMVQLHS